MSLSVVASTHLALASCYVLLLCPALLSVDFARVSDRCSAR